MVSDSDTNNPRAYESIRYTDGKGTVERMAQSMFSADGTKLKTIEYSYVYGDPSKGQMPDVLYSGIFGGRGFNFTYDSLGRLTSRSISFNGDDGVESYTYKASSTSGYTTTLVESMTDFSGVFHTYVYDANGNIVEKSVGDQTIRYEYDSQNRLTRCFDPIAGSTTIYVYDDRGNILKVREADYMTEEELDAYYAEYGDAIFTDTAYTYGDSTWADLLTACNGVSITYDELGNPLTWYSNRNITMTWENGRQLAQFANATSQCDFEYNADGLRTKKTVTNKRNSKVTKSTEYYIVDGQYIGEVTTINGTDYVISYVYDENGTPAGINVNGGAYYFAKNLQGDVVAVIGYDGSIAARYIYNAWGDLKSVKDANGNTITSPTNVGLLNPFRYRGYMYDSETGFYYLRSRYYCPDIGRFINADELLQSDFNESSLFIYGKSNPIKYGDDSGFDAYVLYDTVAAGAGHIGLLIEDEDGEWWHFYWGCSIDLTLLSMFLGSFVTVDTWLVKYEGELTVDAINSSGQYKVGFMEATYEYMIKFEGDFSDSVKAARAITKMDGELAYSLPFQNCTEVSMNILAKSDTEYTNLFIKAKKIVFPKSAYKKVAGGRFKSDFRKGGGLLPVPGILRPFRPL